MTAYQIIIVILLSLSTIVNIATRIIQTKKGITFTIPEENENHENKIQ